MYLVHAHLELPFGRELPYDVRNLLKSALRPDDEVEHLAVHPRSPSWLTLGCYLLAHRLEEAEARTARVCRRLVDEVPALGGARLLDVGVPLLPFLPAAVGGEALPGHIGPRPVRSTRKPFHHP
ncbi:hypothetical protein [Streptomyces sp. NPDC006368]|uniref:hypothetical protein n=1 Tax=Streptomyces sp. NPDC006368 TaxID=3156760 RepID=UPI0033AE49F3